MTKPDNLVHSEFMTNLGTDHLAVNAGGHVVGRASSAEAIRKAVPDAAHYLTAEDFHTPEQQMRDAEAFTGTTEAKYVNIAEPNPVSAGLDAVKAQQAPAPEPDKDIDDKAPKVAPEKAPAKK